MFPLLGKGNDLLKVTTTPGSGIKPKHAEQSGALSSRSVGLCKIRKPVSQRQRVKNFNVPVPERNNCALLLGIRFGKLPGDLPFVQAALKVELSESRDVKEQGH